MSKEKQIDIITELLIDFDEMSFAPTTTVPDPEAYAINWRNNLTNALRDEFEKLNVENETLRICLKDQRGRNAEFQKANEALAKRCEEYEAELLQMPDSHADVAPKSEGEWIKDEKSKFEHRYNCPVCNYRLLGIPTNYCPNCGAKMKGGE